MTLRSKKCVVCGVRFKPTKGRGLAVTCESPECRAARKKQCGSIRRHGAVVSVRTEFCRECGMAFTPRTVRATICPGSRCRNRIKHRKEWKTEVYKAKKKRQRERTKESRAIRGRAWRQHQKATMGTSLMIQRLLGKADRERGLRARDIPDDLIEIKRAHLKYKRKMKEEKQKQTA